MAAPAQRYSVVAIVLHWAIAIAILGMILLGWWMGEAIRDRDLQAQAFAAYQLHKSVGLTVLLLSLARLGWRFLNPPPPFPATMPTWERLAASAVHWAFYVVIIALPLTGWLYVSTGWSVQDDRPLEVPTMYFGLFQVPHVFGLSALADETRAAVAEALAFGHSKLAWAAIALAAVHVGAALKHQFIDKDGVLGRMAPGLPDGVSEPPSTLRNAALAAGLLVVAVAAGASVWSFATPPASRAEASASADVIEAAIENAVEEPPAVETPTAEPPAAASEAGAPPTWRVDRGASQIMFSGVHAGVPFEGRFGAWSAEIRFDPANLDASSAVVTIQTASASDGVPVHDNSLPQREWFDVANHPTATFRTSRIRARSDGTYEARGALTIKGRPIDVDLPFTLRIEGDRAIMDGTTRIRRDDADLGMSSDPDFEYVSREIAVRVHVEATRVR